MKVALYARVSSDRQAEKDLSISAQLRALRKYALERRWDIYKEFIDEAESARTVNRPAFKEMIALARQRQRNFEAILVWKLSRFARNREDSIIYKSLLRKHGVSVVSINEQVDETPAGKLLEGMIEVIDEFYSTNLAQDTIRGMKENAARGYHNGGAPPIGYKTRQVIDGSAKRNVLTPDEHFAPIVRRIFRLYADGVGAKDIVNTLNREGLRTNRGKPWSKTSVYYLLSNEAYIGTLIWGETGSGGASEAVHVENNHPPLVDRELFEKVQYMLAQHSLETSHPRTVHSDYLLSGLVYCGQCGATMLGSAAKSSRFFYYACHNYAKRGKSVCNAKLVNKSQLERTSRTHSHKPLNLFIISFIEHIGLKNN